MSVTRKNIKWLIFGELFSSSNIKMVALLLSRAKRCLGSWVDWTVWSSLPKHASCSLQLAGIFRIIPCHSSIWAKLKKIQFLFSLLGVSQMLYLLPMVCILSHLVYSLLVAYLVVVPAITGLFCWMVIYQCL